ncbi:fumarylacetoacetate hydrolase family protein [Comamonas flocculans]|uniref:Fumarylacetoacetate hydrolase family protein n=1 Tax=Comamonas flocculans TaxID=2597701 RepID=A0A5B8RUS7_9BURK|nr:fumarylacetoacetate hydrolase family protein [Comamonas flocculans]QEA11985.1 fumarylacetoacetate hydrolase family protein [Comamonas flocculans]
MKLASVQIQGQVRAAVVQGAQVATIGAPGEDLGALLRAGTSISEFAALAAQAGEWHALSDAQFLAPVPRPGKAVCVGLNYADHTRESRMEQPAHPTLFMRCASSLAAHESAVRRPPGDDSLDFEGEMVVVIGTGGRHIRREAALSHVFGYAVGNDISVREFQFRSPQWTLGKNVDGTGPWGPWVVTADALPPGGSGLKIETWLNGQVMQSANTSDMIFDVATLVASVSEAMTLEPGDILFSGTPAGVGMGRTPVRYMQPGDVVEVGIERLGLLRNRIVAG